MFANWRRSRTATHGAALRKARALLACRVARFWSPLKDGAWDGAWAPRPPLPSTRPTREDANR